MDILVTLYYALGLYFLTILELPAFARPGKRLDMINSARETLFQNWSKQMKYINWAMTGYYSWICVGFFGSQWPLFLLLFALSLVPKRAAWWIATDAAISIAILLFVLINHLHLHIDVWAAVWSLITTTP